MFKIVYEGGNTKVLLVGVSGQPTQALFPGNDLEVSDDQIAAGVWVGYTEPATDQGDAPAAQPEVEAAPVEGAEAPVQPEVEQGTANG